MNRVYFKGALAIGSEIMLPDEEHHHLVHVLRSKHKERVEVCNGLGDLVGGELNLSKKECRIQLDTLLEKQVKRSDFFELSFSPVKQNDRNEWLLEKAVEAGADRICIIQSERSIKTNMNYKRFEKIMLSAFKQCKRLFLPELAGPFHLFADEIWNSPNQRIGFGHCLPDDEKMRLSDFFIPKSSSTFFIGPEGDFSPDEIRMLKEHKAIPVDLGDTTLRTETAALYVIFARRLMQG